MSILRIVNSVSSLLDDHTKYWLAVLSPETLIQTASCSSGSESGLYNFCNVTEMAGICSLAGSQEDLPSSQFQKVAAMPVKFGRQAIVGDGKA